MLRCIALFDEDSCYSNSVDLFSKRMILQEVISEDAGRAFQALLFIISLESCFQTQIYHVG
jgi:hypothetical protein